MAPDPRSDQSDIDRVRSGRKLSGRGLSGRRQSGGEHPGREHPGRERRARRLAYTRGMLVWAVSFIAAFVGMEAFAFAVHKHVMHGPLWCWHRSHHERSSGGLELNDLFALVFTVPSVFVLYLGWHGFPALEPIGLAMTLYGVLNWLFHDVLVHRRIGHRWTPRAGYLGRIVHAHHVHHRTRSRLGAVSFGFFWAPELRGGGAER